MPLLSEPETNRLLGVLPEEDLEFGEVAKRFERAFEAPDRFKACCAIVLVLEDKTLLAAPQRLALWYCLWDAFKAADLSENPFISFLIEAAADGTAPAPERCLLLQLLQGGSLATLAPLTIQTFAASTESLGAVPPPDTAALRRQYARKPDPEKLSSTSAFGRAAISRLLPDGPAGGASGPPAAAAPDAPAGAAAAAAREREASRRLLRGVVGGLTLAGFEPSWVQPRPPVAAPGPDELRWLPLPLPGQGALVWDSTAGADPARLAAVRDLMGRALKGPLLPAQQHQVLAELEADPKLVHALGLSPGQLPALVANTPVIAYEVLLRLMGSRAIGAYFEVLASMPMSLHSMEVVNRLTSAVDLPTDFVHRYITNCINSCEGIQDKYMQNRLVRLVCVFLQSLIRNKIINIRDLLHEVQAFCINYSRIREAAGLFRLLKLLE